MVLVAQPTHPAFYTDDKRHHICNVCLARYSCPPPSRAELMESFTGPEIAALIDEGRLIAASPQFSDMLAADRNETDARLRRRGDDSYDFWFHGVYLITSVKEDTGELELPLTSSDKLESVRRQLTRDNASNEVSIDVQGTRFLLAPKGSLADVSPSDLGTALDALSAPATLVLVPSTPLSCGDDHVAAVCISRLLAPASTRLQRAEAAVERATSRLRQHYSNVDGALVVQHYAGGPCDQYAVSACLVRGGTGWTVLTDLDEAVALAYRRRESTRHGDVSSGLGVRLCGLQSRPDLNGLVGMALRFDDKAQRWEVRVAGTGEGIKLKPINITLLETEPVHLWVFWGDAQWTRAQLLGEIARGSWGLCRADIEDLLVPVGERWNQLKASNRLAFAPVSEMSEDYIRHATEEMQHARVNALAVIEATREGGSADDQ
ncbi:hypothetical protein B5M09_002055 [Aphanomyces astaci]|uniref:Uncharacterized protein n=1 Tax=Aphanomyces astaci TaxID=112090 RepID=A0A425DBL4_APHAT|nr:hypothetical protein B5M09_002055 [Aphanomyces astaci]